jgi:hypothetical protein
MDDGGEYDVIQGFILEIFKTGTIMTIMQNMQAMPKNVAAAGDTHFAEMVSWTASALSHFPLSHSHVSPELVCELGPSAGHRRSRTPTACSRTRCTTWWMA